MDMQLIGNAYGAAEYAGVYVSKAEPDTIRFKKVIADALKRSDPNLPNHALLKRVANATLSIREISAQEAYYILLRELPLHGKSRTVTGVKVLRHHLRCYRVEKHELQNIISLANTTETGIRIEPIERAYMSRPACAPFNTMSFATFVEEIDVVDKTGNLIVNQDIWARTDGEGYLKKRGESQVIRMSPWIAPDVFKPNFCYAELFLHVPWRTLDELPQTDEECIAAFIDAQQTYLDTELLQESNAKIARQHNLELLKRAGTVQVLNQLPPSEYVFVDTDRNTAVEQNIVDNRPQSDNCPQQWKSKHVYSPEDMVKAREFIKVHVKPWMKEKLAILRNNYRIDSTYRYPVKEERADTYLNETMAESQWVPFSLAMQQSRKCLQAVQECSECPPLHLIINGEGGSGKSWLIDHIVKDVNTVFSGNTTQRSVQRVLLLAHQGTAAFNIKGQTLCSAFGFATFSRSAFSVPYTSLTSLKPGPEKLKKLQQRFKDIHLVIIDGFSVISCGMLYWIDRRMREIWPEHRELAFGGRDVIFTGDSAQLDPVVPYSLSTPLSKIANEVHRKGREIWEGIHSVCTLTSQNSGKLDPEWFDALRRLLRGRPTVDDIELFNSRCINSDDMSKEFLSAKHIAHRNVDVDDANIKNLQSSTVPIIRISAQHHVQQKRLHRQREIPVGTVKALISEAQIANSDRDRVVGTGLALCVGAPVTLTYNIEQSAGLCNGTNGVVYDFVFTSDSELPIVLVQITDQYLGPSFLADVPNIIPVPPKDISWWKKNSDFRVLRRGIPLRLAYAMTVRKVQGITCDQVVFHCNSVPNVAFAYVALSRVRQRSAIALTQHLSIEKLTVGPERLAVLDAEEARVATQVAQTTDRALPVVRAMKHIAQVVNQMNQPRH